MAARKADTILIAGAEGYLGHQAVLYFARRGLKVAASCRTKQDETRVAAFVAEQRLSGVTTLVADLGDEAAVRSLVDGAAKALGRVDALLNAAGGYRWAKTTDVTLQDWDFLMSANAKSAFLLVKHVVPPMLAQGFGRVVLVSSRATLGLGEAGNGAYAASKAAVNALVHGLAVELKGTGVHVNAVAPTVIDTPANRQAMPSADPSRWVTPEQLLDVVQTMIGEGGAALNGAIVPVAGEL